MIPIVNHVYSCTWWKNGDGDSYFNLITNVSSTHIYGKCLYSTDPDYFSTNPNDSNHIEWRISNWNEDALNATITDLGHIDNLPELLI